MMEVLSSIQTLMLTIMMKLLFLLRIIMKVVLSIGTLVLRIMMKVLFINLNNDVTDYDESVIFC